MADISIERLSAVLPATELVQVLQNEIERLRLTAAEREALRIVSSVFPSEKHASTLRGLLKRQVFSQKNMTDRDT